MTSSETRQHEALCDHLAARRKAILRAWRRATDADPEQTTARALTRRQFDDHVPEVLDAFERKLRARPGGKAAARADRDQKKEEVKHGLHRWQQGYRLRELMSEWGHLQHCLFEELDRFAAQHPEFARKVLVNINRQMIAMVNESISESAAQYERMQQAEAASHVAGLRVALDRVNEIERGRATLIHQAVHDLTSNVFAVKLASNLLGDAAVAEDERAGFATLLQHGVQSVTVMLGELMELARLEAGEEHRDLAPFDAGALVTELCAVNQPFAAKRGLVLDCEGPPRLPVEGDAVKVRRLLQNLVGNALKYTTAGDVRVSWDVERETWWIKVSDTGPGLRPGPAAPMVAGLSEATASARESDEKGARAAGEASHVLAPAGSTSEAQAPAQPGEGIGLSIVKRLCELLDASLEVASSADTGTTFRVVLPRSYTPTPRRARTPLTGRPGRSREAVS